MSIESTGLGYAEWLERWRKIRAACAGQHEVRKLREHVLPKLGSQDAQEYDDYLRGALYTNYTGRTLEGLLGMVFRKPPINKITNSFSPIYDDIDLKDNSTPLFAQNVLSEVLKTGRYGVLVEYPQVDPGQISAADAEALNLRPYATGYETESILDYRMQRINNAMQPVMVKLKENVQEWKDETTAGNVEQIRLLLLLNGIYFQRVFRKQETGWVQIGPDIVPTKNGQPIPFIPFYTFGPKNNTLEMQEPPLEDLADINLSHFKTSASYERGCLFTGAPTPVLAGFVFKEGEKVKLGSSSAFTTSDPQAKWGYLEFTGQGLAELVNSMRSKEAQMAAIGARMLAPEKAAAEAQGTLEIRTSGETSALAMIAGLVSEGLEKVLRFMSDWQGLGTDLEFELNKDYMPRKMTAQELTALVQAWQGGAIGQEDLFYNLKQGEIISDAKTFDDYKEQAGQSNLAGL
jgi:hypothetical protein